MLDPRTRQILFKMINKGFVDHVHGAISTGKEANVYHATRNNPTPDQDADVAIKVYKTSILVFKDREQYISGDYRFSNGCSKGNPRKMVRHLLRVRLHPAASCRLSLTRHLPFSGQNVGRKRGAKFVAHARSGYPLPQTFAAAQPRSRHDVHRPRQQGVRAETDVSMSRDCLTLCCRRRHGCAMRM